MNDPEPFRSSLLDRRALLGAVAGAGAALSCSTATARAPAQAGLEPGRPRALRKDHPVAIGSANALAGLKQHYARLADGADPLDVVIDVVKVQEADPEDDSVGLGGLPNADGVVQLDAACMYGPRHKSGAVACIENILHPSEVARLVLERTDHCLLVGKDAYEFARAHGHPHVELLTEASRKKWLEWKENLSKEDDWLPPPPKPPFTGAVLPADDAGARKLAAARARLAARQTGTIHCSAIAKSGAVACTTTTSGLAWKIPGRVGDSPIVGAGLYCDQEVGSAGATGRGESCVLANASAAIIELLRQGAAPLDAGLEVLRRVTAQTQRQARYQPELVDEHGVPSFGLHLYVLGLDGTCAGVTLRGAGQFAVADPEKGPRLEPLVALHAAR
jgi:N4-(beta-N-acetylglucosaminyl)-L-asparaginase